MNWKINKTVCRSRRWSGTRGRITKTILRQAHRWTAAWTTLIETTEEYFSHDGGWSDSRHVWSDRFRQTSLLPITFFQFQRISCCVSADSYQSSSSNVQLSGRSLSISITRILSPISNRSSKDSSIWSHVSRQRLRVTTRSVENQRSTGKLPCQPSNRQDLTSQYPEFITTHSSVRKPQYCQNENNNN